MLERELRELKKDYDKFSFLFKIFVSFFDYAILKSEKEFQIPPPPNKTPAPKALDFPKGSEIVRF